MARELVWAKVPGWNWWPAVVLPAPDNARETRGNRTVKRDDGDNERIVLFLVDKTVARVPPSLPAFTQHYTRFLSATYANKKLFQAVEEARALASEDAAARGLHDETGQQQVIAYPPPVRDDFRKSSKQLLQWLTAAALDPLGQYNKLSDQANKRVLHAVRNNRLLSKDVKPFILAPEQAVADGTSADAARANSLPGTSAADTVVDRLPPKRQRKPQAWLQMYGDLPDALRMNTSTLTGQEPVATGRAAGAATGPAGSVAPHRDNMGRVRSAVASKAGCQLGKLKQQQLVRQHSTTQRGQQQGQGAIDTSGMAASRGRKRTHNATAGGSTAADDSNSDQESSWLTCSDSDDEQQQRQRRHSRGPELSMARKADVGMNPSQLQQRSKKRCLMELVNHSTPGAKTTSTAAVAAAAVAAAFKGASRPVTNTAAGSGSIDQLMGRKGPPGSKASGSRIRARKQQQHQQGAQGSDSDSDEYQPGYQFQESDSDGLSDAYGQVDSTLKWRLNQRNHTSLHRRSSTQRLGHVPVSTTGGNGPDNRCSSPQLLRPDVQPTVVGTAGGIMRAGGMTGLGGGSCCCCCCCGRHRQGHHLWQLQHNGFAHQWQQQQLQQCNPGYSSGTQQAPADWLAEDQDMLGAAAADVAAFPDRQLSCTETEAGVQQQQQQRLPELDVETSLVDVQALTAQGMLSPFTDGALASPASILTAAGAPLCPSAARPAAANNSSRACSIPMLRPPSPLLGAAPVVTVGAELLPGLEEDLQHAAAMFGNSRDSEATFQQQQDGSDRSQQHSGSVQPETAATTAAVGEGYMSDGASAAAAAGVEEPGMASMEFEQTIKQDEGAAAASGGLHPESPSTGSHADLHLLPDWELDVIKSSPQDSELQAEIAAAAANSAAAVRAAAEIPAVLGYKRNALPRSASSTCEDVRRLALARSHSSNKYPDLQTQLQDCKEHLHASTEIVRQLKQQLEAKDEQIAALNSQTSAQARQLQQQAGELMALRALLGKQQKHPACAAAAEVSTAAGSGSPSGGSSKAAEDAAADADIAVVVAAASDEQVAPTGTAAAEQPAAQPVRRSCRLSAASKAAAKDSVSSAFLIASPAGAAASGTATDEQSSEEGVTEADDLRQQLTDAKLLVSTLEGQLQEARRQTNLMAQQQQTEVSQWKGWLQAAEIDAALMRSENELLKKVLPTSVVAKVAATARKPAAKAAAARAAGGKAAAGKADSSQAGSSRGKGGRGISAMKALLASQKAAAAAVNQDGAPDAQVTDAKQLTTNSATTLAPCRVTDVFNRQPKLQMPLQAITLSTGATANPQTLAAALAALRESATAGAGGSVSSSSTAAVQAMSCARLPIASSALSAAAVQHTRPAYLSLAPGAAANGVSGPMLVLRPPAGMPLATVLQLNAALSHLAASAGKTVQAGAAAVLTPAGTATAGTVSVPVSVSGGQASNGAPPGNIADKGAATQVLVLNAPHRTAVKGPGDMHPAAAAALAQFAVTGAAVAPALAKLHGATAVEVAPSKASIKQGLNLNDM